VRSGTIKKRKSFVPETIKKRLESYPGWSDLVRLRKKTGPIMPNCISVSEECYSADVFVVSAKFFSKTLTLH